MLTEFTTVEEVRAVLGVADTEIDDATVLLPLYSTLLEEDLEDVNAGLVDLFRTTSAIPPASRSAVQKRFVNLTRLFSSYAVAKQMLTSLPYFAVQRLADGRAQMQRINNPFEDTAAGVFGAINDLRVRLSEAFLAAGGSGEAQVQVTRTWATSTGLAVDPVTNS